jgi:hypothetical protein
VAALIWWREMADNGFAMRFPAAALTILALALPLAGCGSGGSKAAGGSAAGTPGASGSGAFSTHAGIAFGAFYRFIYTPYRAGAFNPARRDRLAFVRARSAAFLVAREIDAATRATRDSAALARLRAPMVTLDRGFKIGLAKLRAGRLNLAEIEAANIAISAIKGSAANSGLTIAESS